MGSRYKRYSINPQPKKKQPAFPRPMMANLGHPGFTASYPLVMTNSLPWNITMLLIGKPSISMGHFPWRTVK